MNNYKNNGEFNLILGCMFSGKTSELIRRYNRYSIGGKKCLMIKYKNDNRYDSEMVVTHDNIKANAIVCEFLYEADEIIKDYDVICIDEVQFYKDANIFCDKWAHENKIIEACGLNGTFDRKPFPMISLLIPLAEDITFYKAICKETGNDAVYSKLNFELDSNNKNNNEIIGGSEKYTAVDRKTFFKKKQPNYCDQFIKFYFKLNGYSHYVNTKHIYICDPSEKKSYKELASEILIDCINQIKKNHAINTKDAHHC